MTREITDGVVMRPFGPTMYKNKITEESRLEIMACANNSEEYIPQLLAGNIEREVSTEFSQEFYDELRAHLDDYLDQCTKVGSYKPPPYMLMNARIERPWVNVQKKGEWNPPHIHGGDFSCVIYGSVPEELKDEWKHPSQQGRNPTGGMIEWQYGQWAPHNMISLGPVPPEEGDIFIFPAWLLHYVYPFNADVERVSCSTNFFLTYESLAENSAAVSGGQE
tara:strand:+ start:171 stop:833 length:663 start_codon:yes stop_codon:yes gene_type:complete